MIKFSLSMKINFLSISLLVLIVNISHAQQEGDYSEDFNKDGIPDKMEIWYDGGSGFGGYYGHVKNGATGKIYELNTWGCFCDIKLVVPFPPEARLSEHKPFYDALAEKLFPDIQAEPDPTLDWIIQANLQAIIPVEDDLFDLILPVKPFWNNGPIGKISKYQLKIDDRMIKSAYHPIQEPPAWIDESKEGSLEYYGNNHDLHQEQINVEESDLILWRGKHSLILKNGSDEAVLFVTDHPLTSGPERLRDPSISSVVSNGEFAFFTVSETPEPAFRIFVSDLNTGRVARLKAPFFGYGGKISIEENKLYNQEGQIVVEDVSNVLTNLAERNF